MVRSVQIPSGKKDLGAVLDDLRTRGITNLLVEGGPDVLHSFVEQGLWDEARVIKSPVIWGKGKPSPALSGTITQSFQMEKDFIYIYKNQ